MFFIRSTTLIILLSFSTILIQAKPIYPLSSTNIKDYIRYFLVMNGFENEYQRFLSYIKIVPPKENLHLRALYDDLFSSNAYLSDLIDTYAKYYTFDDIIHLIQFYSSPLGEKVNQFQNILSQQIEDIMLNKISDYIFSATEYGYTINLPEFN